MKQRRDFENVAAAHFALPACRYPNAGAAEGAELCTHGCWANGIKEWHKNTSCVGKAEVIYKDLRDCDDEMKIASGPLAGQPCKNDSAMWDTYSESQATVGLA